MFEHVQQRNRSRLLVPVLALVGICVVVYLLIDRWSRTSNEREIDTFFHGASVPRILTERSLERVELPGMSIALPTGKPVIKGDYIAGSAEIDDIGVAWTPGRLIMDAAFEQQQFRSFGGGAQPPTTTKLGGSPAFEEHVGDTIHIMAGSCGRRIVLLSIRTSREQFDHIKDSFACTPDRALLHLGVIVAPGNWKRTTDDPNLHLEGPNGDVMTVRRRSQDSQDNTAFGIPEGTEPEVRGAYKIWRGKGSGLDGKPRVTGLVEWPCPDQIYRGSVLIVSATSVDAGIAIAMTGSCIAPTAALPAELAPPP